MEREGSGVAERSMQLARLGYVPASVTAGFGEIAKSNHALENSRSDAQHARALATASHFYQGKYNVGVCLRLVALAAVCLAASMQSKSLRVFRDV